MTFILRLVFAFLLTSLLGFAESWTGALVDSGCYSGIRANTSHDAGHTGVNLRRVMRACSPKRNTKSFALVEKNGSTFSLDCTGNEAAMQDFLNATESPHIVLVRGEANDHKITVESISRAK